jgi:UDP-glucuronate 4-epimerase
MMASKKVLVTGAAGFIGFHLTNKLCMAGYEVIGVDNLNDYYDVSLKRARLGILSEDPAFRFVQADIENYAEMEQIFKGNNIRYVVNLAAQAGVRYSITNPHAYIKSNIVGFAAILELCRHYPVDHLVYASSSSVYGANTKLPFSVNDNVDHPISLYAASKKSNELMAHTYSALYNLPTTGLRFFTVYGPYGRPDMALFIFTKAILEGKTIDIFNNGNMKRDFTYVEDIVEGIARLIPKPAKPDLQWSGLKPNPATSFAPYRIFNIGNNSPSNLLKFVETIETLIGKQTTKRFLPLQEGDVPETFADIDSLVNEIDFRPATPLETGIAKFVDWYRDYYKV